MAKLIYNLNQLDHTVTRGNGVIKAPTLEALDEARLIIEVAEEKARIIGDRAKRDYKAEKARGYREGSERADLDALARLLAEQTLLNRTLARLEGAFADLVKACVRKILAEFDDAALLHSVVAKALSRLKQEGHLQIHSPPALMTTFALIARRLEAEIEGIGAIELVEDSSLEAPDFVVESGAGRIECSVPRRIRDLEALIDDVVTRMGEGGAGHLAEGKVSE